MAVSMEMDSGELEVEDLGESSEAEVPSAKRQKELGTKIALVSSLL